MQIKMTLDRDSLWYINLKVTKDKQGCLLCAETLWEDVKIPEGTKTIWAVFSKRKPKGVLPYTLSKFGSPVESDRYILSETRKVLRGIAKLGYKYVHFEY